MEAADSLRLALSVFVFLVELGYYSRCRYTLKIRVQEIAHKGKLDGNRPSKIVYIREPG